MSTEYRSARMYVKLPRYVGSWLKTKYKSPDGYAAEVRLPEMAHPAGRIIYLHLTVNPKMKALATRCVTSDMYMLDPDAVPEDIRAALPYGDARRDFVSVALPKAHFYMGRWIADSPWMQLGAADTTEFVRLLNDEFWQDFDDYWADRVEYYKRRYPGKQPVFYDSILDFVDLFRIDIDDTDALYRAAKRRKASMRENKSDISND